MNMTCQLLDLNILLFKNLKIKIYKIVILYILCYGYEIWSLTLRDKYREHLIALHVSLCSVTKIETNKICCL